MKYSQKDKQKRGSSFEREFKASTHLIDCWTYKLFTTLSGTPFDYLLLTSKTNYGIELKRIASSKLPYSLIRENQRIGLTRFEKLPRNKSIILCNIKKERENRTFIIPWKAVQKTVCSGRNGSINVKQYPEIPRVHRNGKLVWDLTILLNGGIS